MRTSLLAFAMVSLIAVASAAVLALGERDAAPAEAVSLGAPSNADNVANGAGLPDLTVVSITFEQTSSSCSSPSYALFVTIANIGDATAGTFVLALNELQQTMQGGFPPGQVTLPGYPLPIAGPITVTIDATSLITESDETNNSLTVPPFPTPSPVPTCTATPTATPIPDSDGDGLNDAVDNCPTNANPGQENNDRNFIDHSPPYPAAIDDKTLAMSDTPGDACDPDDDNDGLIDSKEVYDPCELMPPPCVPSPCYSSGTYPHIADTDGDRYLDGVECALGTNPSWSPSRPSITACGPEGDADGDKLTDRIEYCFYGTDPLVVDSDGDGTKDGCEAASLNPDRTVNVADRGMLAVAIANPAMRHVNVDVNKDGAWNVGDMGVLMTLFGTTNCPVVP